MGLTAKVLGVGRDADGVNVELDEAVCRTFCERTATACFCDWIQGWGTFLRGEAKKDKCKK